MNTKKCQRYAGIHITGKSPAIDCPDFSYYSDQKSILKCILGSFLPNIIRNHRLWRNIPDEVSHQGIFRHIFSNLIFFGRKHLYIYQTIVF